MVCQLVHGWNLPKMKRTRQTCLYQSKPFASEKYYGCYCACVQRLFHWLVGNFGKFPAKKGPTLQGSDDCSRSLISDYTGTRRENVAHNLKERAPRANSWIEQVNQMRIMSKVIFSFDFHTCNYAKKHRCSRRYSQRFNRSASWLSSVFFDLWTVLLGWCLGWLFF